MAISVKYAKFQPGFRKLNVIIRSILVGIHVNSFALNTFQGLVEYNNCVH